MLFRSLFILVLLFGIFSILFGLPGTVIILLDAFVYAALTGFEKIGIKVLLTLLLLSILAEVAEFAVGMSGAVKSGASQAGFVAFLIGGFLGAALLTPVLYGLGIILGAYLGGFLAMLLVELIRRNRLKPSLRAAWGAILGRTAGIVVKGFFALIMAVITLTAVYS